MKSTISVGWVDDGQPNHQVFDNWGELISFLCINKNVDLSVTIYEQSCMTCPIQDLCDVQEEES